MSKHGRQIFKWIFLANHFLIELFLNELIVIISFNYFRLFRTFRLNLRSSTCHFGHLIMNRNYYRNWCYNHLKGDSIAIPAGSCLIFCSFSRFSRYSKQAWWEFYDSSTAKIESSTPYCQAIGQSRVLVNVFGVWFLLVFVVFFFKTIW